MSPAKEALAKIRELKQKLAEAESGSVEPIAIVSTACRFPKSSDTPEKFWESLINKTDEVSEVPPERWDRDAFFDEDQEAPGKMYTLRGSFLDKIDEMDADFFGISPREATWVDPQQRLFLEVGWEAIERAGWASDEVVKDTGVFVGWMHNDYQNTATDVLRDLNPYIATGSAGSFLCGRLSYYLGVQGPSLAVDTACSSSLVALHLACQSLRQKECGRALVGGVNVMVSPKTTVMTCKLQALSPHGHSRAFDATADGYLRGEGCGVIALRRLSDAQKDGDNVLAVIRGSAVTHNGFSSGLTAPNPESQKLVIRKALENAGRTAHEIDYLEAHGTGTELGDPIEMNAAASVLAAGREKSAPLLVGSVKTNLGHLEAAAGIAGVIKTVLAIQKNQIPAHLHFETPNPHINWERDAVEVVTEARAWPGDDRHTAGVSAFGMSGTNAHIIIESPPTEQGTVPDRTLYSPETEPVKPELITLSGKNEGAVRDLAERYYTFLKENRDIGLTDMAYTAATDRRHFENRAGIVAIDRKTAENRLSALASGRETEGTFHGSAKPKPVVAWQFTGQGSQYVGMGRDLYQSEKVFRETMDRCAEELSQYRSGNLCQIIAEDGEQLGDTYWTQPALFAIHLSLAELMKSWGIHPDMVLGHSLGQYAAACVAGMLDWKSGIKLIHERSRLTSSLPAGGAMAAVFSSSELVEAVVAQQDKLSVAAHNGTHLVISGPEASVAAAEKEFEAKQIRVKRLATSHAFHSALLDPILDEFESIVDTIPFQTGHIPLICNITGEALAADFIPDGKYWRTQLREAVQYTKSIQHLDALRCDLLVELGPLPVLTRMAAASWAGDPAALISSLDKDSDDKVSIKETVAKLYQHGVNPDFESLTNPDKNRKAVALPTYPFQRKYFWGPEKPGMLQVREGTQHPILGGKRALAGVQNETRFESHISPERQRWLTDHRVFDDILFPGAGYVEMLVSAAPESTVLEDIAFEMPLMIQKPVTMQTIVNDRLEIHSTEGENLPWIRNVSAAYSPGEFSPGSVQSLSKIEANCPEVADVKAFYEMFATLGIQYGTEFQTIKSLRYSDTEVLAKLELNGEHQGFQLPPMLLDGAFQSLAVGLLRDPESSLFLPVGIGKYQSSGRAIKQSLWCHGKWNETEGDTRTADITLFDDRGQVVVKLEKLQVRAVSRSALRQMVGSTTERLLYSLSWRTESLPPANTSNSHFLVISETETAIAAELQKKGQTVTEIALTDQATESTFWLNLLTEPIDGIIWNTQKGKDDTNYTKRHCAGTLALLTALKSKKIEALSRGFQFITVNAIPAVDGDLIEPDSSQFWGFGRVVTNENPPLRGRLVDYSPDNLENLIEALLSEAAETQMALRGEQVLIPRLVPSKAPALTTGLPVVSDATYLITGGLGMLGRRAAEWLADRGAGHIVLVSRREPNDSAKQVIREIESKGCKIHVMLADISDRTSLDSLLKNIAAELPPLRGILHAAGVLDDGLLAEQTWEKFEKVLAPKRTGSALLHELTLGCTLDFFVLYSSAASVLGSPGQANYAMGNAYLDGLAYKRVSEGLPAISVNFGPWNEGMAATEKVKKALDMQGLTPLTAEEAHECIDRMLDNGLVQATMLDADWGQMRQRFPADPPAILEELWPETMQNNPADAVLLEKLREAEDNEDDETPREDIFREHVEAELQQVLSLSKPPGADVPLAELGLDSLMAVEFATRLQRQVGKAFAIPPTLAFDYPSVSKLTDFLSNLISSVPAAQAPKTEAAATVTFENDEESVAIIGMGCRFPGADGISDYWELLRNGVDATSQIPNDRWDIDALYDPTPKNGKIYTKRGGFLKDIAEFDAEFFGLSKEDAIWMDPQHRMMLEVSWHALQNAGIDPKNIPDPDVGVFMGIMSTDYAQLREKFSPLEISGSQGAGLSHSAGVGRVSYMLGLEGPAIAVDTASSSSLVAVCQAARSLLEGECNLALAGGVNAILSPVNSLLLCKGKVLAPDGRCKSFSAEADGFARGEGCGVIALKRRSDAERDGDRILAVIRGSAIGHNGQNAGLTAPSGKSQQQMISRALAKARLSPADIQYLEAHATGTELGDPIEVIAATNVYGQGRTKKNPLLLGSAKANLGHLEAAGGISGLIKLTLAMHHGVIPRQINFKHPSKHIPWDQIPATVVTEETAWPNPDRPIAGVSALGMTGTNAHVILEGVPNVHSSVVPLPPQTFRRKRYWFDS